VTGRRAQRFAPRVGKAVEPMVHEDEDDMEETDSTKTGVNSGGEILREELRNEARFTSSSPLSEETQAAARLPGDEDIPAKTQVDADEMEKLKQSIATEDKIITAGPMETVLEMPMPESPEEQNAAKPPHLQTPPYVHHFDTYTLVQQVQAGGFTTEQAITSLKAVRGLLAQNLGVAKAGLVSKSDVENVSIARGSGEMFADLFYRSHICSEQPALS